MQEPEEKNTALTKAYEILTALGPVPMSVEEKLESLEPILSGKCSLETIDALMTEWSGQAQVALLHSQIVDSLRREWMEFVNQQEEPHLLVQLEDAVNQLLQARGDENFLKALPKPSDWLTQLEKVFFGNSNSEAKSVMVTSLYFQKLGLVSHQMNRSIPAQIRQPPILISGHTGTGKTYLIKEACRIAGVEYMTINAAQLVPEGLVGTTLSDIGRMLYGRVSEDLDRAMFAVICLDEIDKLLGSANGQQVLNQLLTIMDGTCPLRFEHHHHGKRKVVEIPTENIFFILSGSFAQDGQISEQEGNGLEIKSHFSRLKQDKCNYPLGIETHQVLYDSSMPAELAGRISQVIRLNPPDDSCLLDIIEHSPRSPLVRVRQRLALFDCKLEVSETFKQQLLNIGLVTIYGVRSVFIALEAMISRAQFELLAPVNQGKTFFLNEETIGGLQNVSFACGIRDIH